MHFVKVQYIGLNKSASVLNWVISIFCLRCVLNPEYAFDFLLQGKIPLKLDVNSVSLMQHTSSVCFTHETANFFGLLPLITNSNA